MSTRSDAPVPYKQPCHAPWFAAGGHAQTLWGHVLPSRGAAVSTRPDARRMQVALGDGDELVAYALPGTSGLRVHLFHGLSGDVDADYMHHLSALA